MTLPKDPKETVETTSILHGPLRLTFSDDSSRDRAAKGYRPDKVYRASHEKQGTLASVVSRAKHSPHPDNKGLKLMPHNAFQGPGTLKPDLDFTKERIMRHLDARRTVNPTPFISTTSEEKTARKKLEDSRKTRKFPNCTTVTSFDISRLVPGTLTADMTTTIDSHDPEHVDTNRIEPKVYHGVKIPIWVLFQDDYEGPAHERPDCTVNDVLEAGGIFWFWLNELKDSDLHVWASDDHRNEWLAVGSIPLSIVIEVMPYDGSVHHTSKTDQCIQARSSPEPHLFNWDNACWDHIPGLKNQADLPDYRPYRLAKAGEKRPYDEAKIGAAVAAEVEELRKRNRRSNSAVGAEGDAAPELDNAATRAADAMPFEVTISHPSHAPHSFMVRPEDYPY